MSKLTTSFVIAGAVIGLYCIGKYACQKVLSKKAVKEPEAEPVQAPVTDQQPVVEEQPAAEPVATTEPVEQVVEEQPVVEPVVDQVVEEQPVVEEEPVAVETVAEQAAVVVEETVVEAQPVEPEVVAEEPTKSAWQTAVEEALVEMGAEEQPEQPVVEEPEVVVEEQPVAQKGPKNPKKDPKEETRKLKAWFDVLYNKSGNRAKWDPEWVIDNDYQDALFTPVPAGTVKFHAVSSTGTKLIWSREIGGIEIDTGYPVVLFWDKSIGKLCVSFFHNAAKEPRCFEIGEFASLGKFLTNIPL